MPDELAPAYLISGDDDFLAEEALRSLLGSAGDHSVAEFPATDGVRGVIEAARTPSVFGDRRILLMRDAHELPADEARSLIDYLEQPSEDATVILMSTKKLAKVASAIKKVGQVIEASKGRRSDLFGWLRAEAKKRELAPSGDALGALVEAVGEERMALAHALDELKLSLADGRRFGEDDVKKQFQRRSGGRLFGFIDAVATRRLGEALESLHHLMASGESPQSVYWVLTRHFRMLLAADASASTVAKSLGIQTWRAEKLVKQARAFEEAELIDAYRTLVKADHKMKTSVEPESLTLERAVVEIAGAARR